MEGPKKRAAQDQESAGAEYPAAFPHHHMGLADVLNDLSCKYDVDRPVSERKV